MYKVISANRGPLRAPKNWRVFEKEMMEKHFGPVLDVNGEDGSSVLTAYEQYKDTVSYIRWYPDPELLNAIEYNGILNQNKLIGNLPYITNSASGFINVQNKEAAFKIWKEHNVNCPEFFVYRDKTDFYLQQEKHNIAFPFLIRLNNSVNGYNSHLVHNINELDDILTKMDNEYLDYIRTNSRIDTKKLCIQLINTIDQYNDVNISFRIHVAGARVVSGYARVVDADDWCAITSGKFKPKHFNNFIRYNELCEHIMTEYEHEICRAVHVLGLNHQGIDVIIDQDTNTLCFLEVQPTYASGYPTIGASGYFPPYYNPSEPTLVKFLQDNETELSKMMPRYYFNWLDKQNHFDLVYKFLKEYIHESRI